MRLNDFFDKPQISKPRRKQVISFVNEAKDNAFKKEISDLKNQLVSFKDTENDNKVLRKRINKLNTRINDLDETRNKIKSENALLELDKKRNSELRMEKEGLQGTLKGLENELVNAKSNLEPAILSKSELQKTHTILQETTDTLKIDNRSLLEYKDRIDSDLQNKNKQLRKLREEIKEIKQIFDAIEVKYNESKVKNEDLGNNVVYWKSVAKTLQEERDYLDYNSKRLKEVVDTITFENTEQKGVGKLKQAELTNLKNTVATMTTHIEDLTEQNTYLAGLSSALKLELDKPRYMSMSQIERSEGFKMPMGGSRSHFLGHSKPTLLKFKTGGNKNDN